MTTLVAGPAGAFTEEQIAHMIGHARADLAAVAPITTQLGKIRIAQHWPWADELATAYNRLAALPRPIG